MKRNLGATTGLLAMVTLGVHTLVPSAENRRTSNGGGQGDSSQAAGKQDDTENAREGPWLATRAFFGGSGKGKVSGDVPAREDQIQPLVNGLTSTAVSAAMVTPLKDLFGVDQTVCRVADSYSVVATVADPVHSRLALFFDGQVDSIERAAEEQGWVFAQQWLPWSDPFDGSEHDVNARRKQRRLLREQESLPGILIFRANAYRKSGCLFVLLTPETPTGGVGEDSMMAALNTASLLSPANKTGLLSPSFTGSFPSLGQTLSRWGNAPENRGRLYQTSYGGSVSGKVESDLFVRGLKGQQSGLDSFYSGILSNSDILENAGLGRALREKYRLAPESVAYLLEQESGSSAAKIQLLKGEQYYTVPRDISHLRNAWQEASANISGHTGNPIPSVKLSLNDPNRGEDSVPVFSDKDTPVAQSAALGAITEDMNRRGIRLALIAATNSLDELFLAQFLHEHCPAVRIVVSGDTDLLFMPAAAQRALVGTLFLSSYPMFFEGDEALAAGASFGRYNLLSGELQGLFNVTQLLLWHLDGSNAKPLPSRLRGYAAMMPDGKGQSYPGLWLLTLTRFGFSPVDWFPTPTATGWLEQSPNAPQAASGRLHQPLASSGWYVTSRLTAIAILAACISFCFSLKRTSRISWQVWTSPGDPAAVRFPFFAGAAVFISSLPWILGLPAALEWNNAPTGQNFTVVLLGLAFLAPFGSLLWIGAQRSAIGAKQASWYTDPMLLFAVPFYVLILITWWVLCSGDNVSNAMFRWRALHFYSSSSPALPVWLVCNVVVIGLLAEFCRRCDTGVTSAHLQLEGIRDISAFAACYAEVNALIAGTHKSTRVFTCALVAGISMMLLWQHLPAFEADGYNAVLRIAVFALIWALASLAHDSVLIWLNFSKLLSMVESIPLRGVISRVARALPRRQVWAFWKSTPQRALAVRMCEALHNRALAANDDVKKAFAAGVGGAPLVAPAQKEEQAESALAYSFLALTRRRFEGEPGMSAEDAYTARREYEESAACIGRGSVQGGAMASMDEVSDRRNHRRGNR